MAQSVETGKLDLTEKENSDTASSLMALSGGSQVWSRTHFSICSFGNEVLLLIDGWTYQCDLPYMIPRHDGRTILSSVASSDSFVSVMEGVPRAR